MIQTKELVKISLSSKAITNKDFFQTKEYFYNGCKNSVWL